MIHRKNCSDGRNQDPCPVTWVFNYDSDRFPDTLVEARCKRCERGSMTGFTCRPVYYYTKVLRKGNCDRETGVYSYEPVYEQVSISCSLHVMGAIEGAKLARAHSQNEFNRMS
ncbi:hypothetical protein C0Q70_08430 [Pomacea canaliculata]|uniref:Uncharacterized protein n=1 Tax=Pomacea canaliculata TaxID=400727 RepID=A0A2T7PHT9_POMCA|nr:hypothetical protein C0Q70_08430 [Pomacea canaliculata]